MSELLLGEDVLVAIRYAGTHPDLAHLPAWHGGAPGAVHLDPLCPRVASAPGTVATHGTHADEVCCWTQQVGTQLERVVAPARGWARVGHRWLTGGADGPTRAQGLVATSRTRHIGATPVPGSVPAAVDDRIAALVDAELSTRADQVTAAWVATVESVAGLLVQHPELATGHGWVPDVLDVAEAIWCGTADPAWVGPWWQLVSAPRRWLMLEAELVWASVDLAFVADHLVLVGPWLLLSVPQLWMTPVPGSLSWFVHDTGIGTAHPDDVAAAVKIAGRDVTGDLVAACAAARHR